MTIGVDFLVKRVAWSSMSLLVNGDEVHIPETNVAVELYIVDCGGFSVCQDSAGRAERKRSLEDVLRPQWETANAMMLAPRLKRMWLRKRSLGGV